MEKRDEKSTDTDLSYKESFIKYTCKKCRSLILYNLSKNISGPFEAENQKIYICQLCLIYCKMDLNKKRILQILDKFNPNKTYFTCTPDETKRYYVWGISFNTKNKTNRGVGINETVLSLVNNYCEKIPLHCQKENKTQV